MVFLAFQVSCVLLLLTFFSTTLVIGSSNQDELKVSLALGYSLHPVRIKEGDDIYFECRVTLERPVPYEVLWLFDNRTITQDLMNGIIISNSSLVLQKVIRSFSGDYTCIASTARVEGRSNVVSLRVQYKPTCSSHNIHEYKAPKNYEISVTCQLDSDPPVDNFHWQVNSNGDLMDIDRRYFTSQGQQSSLSYTARTAHDYGTLLCWGSNYLGRQKDPCLYTIIPEGLPNPPSDCSVTNQTTEMLKVICQPGTNTEFEQRFIIDVYESDSESLKFSLTETSMPEFTIQGLEPGSSYLFHIYAANTNDVSEKIHLEGHTLNESNVPLEQQILELKGLLIKQEQSLTAFASALGTGIKEELGKVGEQNEVTSEMICSMQLALVALLQGNVGNDSAEIISKLQTPTGCRARNAITTTEVDCHPVQMKPDETVGMFHVNSQHLGNCSNPEPIVGMNKCSGHCTSSTVYEKEEQQGSFVSRCTCCKPSRFEKITVLLTCGTGQTFSRSYNNINACQCLSCEDIGK